MKKTKIIITICMVAVLMMILCVSAFASGNVLEGEKTVNNQELLGTWVFINDLPILTTAKFDIKFESNGTEYYGIEVIADDLNPRMLFINEDNTTVTAYIAYNSVWENENFKTINITEYRGPEDDEVYESYVVSLNYFATKTGPIISSSIGILDVASEIPSFLTTGLTTVTALFYTDGELTFVGYLAIASLAISVCFLVISIIRNFLHFRG